MTRLPGACALLLCLGVAARGAPPGESIGPRIDGFFVKAAADAGVKPAPLCDDATFLRRVSLDLSGTLPSPERTAAFLGDKQPDKRAKLVDEILAGDAYTEYWARLLLDTLTNGQRPTLAGNNDNRVLYDYLVDSLADGKSYRDLVRELIVGEGLNQDSGPANFLLRYEANADALAGTTAKLFLGVSLRCAQCHNHPFEKWTQDDFRGVSAFFARVRSYTVNSDEGLVGVVEKGRGDYTIPDTSVPPNADGVQPTKIIPARTLDGAKLKAARSRRSQFADWVVSESNPYFARNGVNRVWQRLFGRGLVEPLDGLGKTPGANAELLDGLGQQFARDGFSLEKLLRGIVLSETYQRSSDSAAEGTVSVERQSEARIAEDRTLAVFPVRPLNIDQVYQAVAAATGLRDDAVRPPDQEPYRDPPTEQFKQNQPSLQRSLALLNGSYVEQAVEKGAKQARAASGRRVGAAHVERLFMATLCRKPTADEAARMMEIVNDSEDKTKGLEDVLWALLNSAEFQTNH